MPPGFDRQFRQCPNLCGLARLILLVGAEWVVSEKRVRVARVSVEEQVAVGRLVAAGPAAGVPEEPASGPASQVPHLRCSRKSCKQLSSQRVCLKRSKAHRRLDKALDLT